MVLVDPDAQAAKDSIRDCMAFHNRCNAHLRIVRRCSSVRLLLSPSNSIGRPSFFFLTPESVPDAAPPLPDKVCPLPTGAADGPALEAHSAGVKGAKAVSSPSESASGLRPAPLSQREMDMAFVRLATLPSGMAGLHGSATSRSHSHSHPVSLR